MAVFTFVIKKFPALFVLTVVAAVIAEPLTFLALQSTGNFAEFASLAHTDIATGGVIASLVESWRSLLIVLTGFTLFLALISVPVIRHVTHNEKLWLIRVNTNTARHMVCQVPAILILAGIALFILMATAGLDRVFTDSPGKPGLMTILLLFLIIIVLTYFGARFTLIPVAAVAGDSLNIGRGFGLTKGNGFRLVLVFLMVGIPMLIVGLIAMDKVLMLYSTNQESLTTVGEPDAANIFNGGPRQILELYVYIFSKPVFITANTIVLLFLSLATGSILGIPAIAYHKLNK